MLKAILKMEPEAPRHFVLAWQIPQEYHDQYSEEYYNEFDHDEDFIDPFDMDQENYYEYYDNDYGHQIDFGYGTDLWIDYHDIEDPDEQAFFRSAVRDYYIEED